MKYLFYSFIRIPTMYKLSHYYSVNNIHKTNKKQFTPPRARLYYILHFFAELDSLRYNLRQTLLHCTRNNPLAVLCIYYPLTSS